MDKSRSVSRTKHSPVSGDLLDPPDHPDHPDHLDHLDHPARPVARGEAARIAIAYGALFFLMGIHLPYWPVWLASRGMDPAAVGLLLGVGLWARLASPLFGRLVDRGRRVDTIVRVLALGTLAAYIGFGSAEGFASLVVWAVLLGVASSPIMALFDGQALTAASAGRLDYGRVRAWGSAAFIAASLLGGVLLEDRPEELIRWTLVASATALVVGSWILPAGRTRVPATGRGPTVRELIARPGVVLFLATAAALQGGHAVLYAFGTQWWRSIGIDESTIGALWAEGVLVEIGLFAVGTRLTRRMGSTGLLAIAGIGGLVRWPALAVTTSLPALFAIQSLHAATFAAMHLGAIAWIREHVPADAVHRATALYGAVAGGLALGIGLPTAGALYERFTGDAFHFMAIPALAGLLLALWLRARSHRLGDP
jgi:PPP family 3-phenylpropionic acid transporter